MTKNAAVVAQCVTTTVTVGFSMVAVVSCWTAYVSALLIPAFRQLGSAAKQAAFVATAMSLSPPE